MYTNELYIGQQQLGAADRDLQGAGADARGPKTQTHGAICIKAV